MINGFYIKKVIAGIFGCLGISELMLRRMNKRLKGNYIRVINYHHVTNNKNFEKQIKYIKKRFDNIDYDSFVDFFLTGDLSGNRPGIIISFDDGYLDNYDVAVDILEKNKMTGWFMVSSDLVDKQGYMGWKHLKEIVSRGHVIGDHTSTHHRMNEKDANDVLEYEIVESKKKLETELGINIDIFCWCGGEEEHYTKEAARTVKQAGFKYGFMTNSFPVTKQTDCFQIQRINIEDEWSILLLKLQICGFMDKWFKKKRNRVNSVTS